MANVENALTLRERVSMKVGTANLKSRLMYAGGLVAVAGTSLVGTASANDSLDLSFLGGLFESVTSILPAASDFLDAAAPFAIKAIIVLGIIYFVAKHAGIKL